VSRAWLWNPTGWLRSGSAATRLRKGTLQCPLLPESGRIVKMFTLGRRPLPPRPTRKSRLKIRIARPGVNTQQFRYIDHNAVWRALPGRLTSLARIL
jgi:hypothetical protein